MKGTIPTLLDAPADQRMFARGDAWICAGEIRAMASAVAPAMTRTKGDVFLHTDHAAHFVAGLLAAAQTGKRLVLPAHTQDAYLAEIGCARGALIDDGCFDARGAEIGAAEPNPSLVFFTSGSTGAPKPVEKPLASLETEVRALEKLWGAEAAHVRGTVSHQHIYGLLYRVLWPLIAGRTSDDCAAQFWEDLSGRLGGATLISSPAHLTRLPPRGEFFAAPPAQVFSSGQLLPTDAAHTCAAAFGAAPIEVLGSTETGGVAWRRQESAETPWTPFANVVVLENEEGAMMVRSPYMPNDLAHATGDGVALLADGRFHLRPRLDRVAKIDGKRVSLARVEQALVGLAQVSAIAALALPERRGALGAVVQLSTAGQAELETLGAFRMSRHLRQLAAAQLEPAERPKHWRFVDAVPTDSQGKRVQAALAGLFDSDDVLAPLDLEIETRGEAEAEIRFDLAPDLIFFAGHFPERPILPGVAQAHMAVLLAQKLWGFWPSDAQLARVKFKRTLAPRDRVLLKLRRDQRIGRLYFEYSLDGEEVSRGEIGGS